MSNQANDNAYLQWKAQNPYGQYSDYSMYIARQAQKIDETNAREQERRQLQSTRGGQFTPLDYMSQSQKNRVAFEAKEEEDGSMSYVSYGNVKPTITGSNMTQMARQQQIDYEQRLVEQRAQQYVQHTPQYIQYQPQQQYAQYVPQQHYTQYQAPINRQLAGPGWTDSERFVDTGAEQRAALKLQEAEDARMARAQQDQYDRELRQPIAYDPELVDRARRAETQNESFERMLREKDEELNKYRSMHESLLKAQRAEQETLECQQRQLREKDNQLEAEKRRAESLQAAADQKARQSNNLFDVFQVSTQPISVTDISKSVKSTKDMFTGPRVGTPVPEKTIKIPKIPIYYTAPIPGRYSEDSTFLPVVATIKIISDKIDIPTKTGYWTHYNLTFWYAILAAAKLHNIKIPDEFDTELSLSNVVTFRNAIRKFNTNGDSSRDNPDDEDIYKAAMTLGIYLVVVVDGRQRCFGNVSNPQVELLQKGNEFQVAITTNSLIPRAKELVHMGLGALITID